MPALVSISPDKLRVIDGWKNAAAGSLLQIKLGHQMTVALRCEHDQAGSKQPHLVVIDGPSAGHLIRPGEIFPYVIDVSHLARIVIRDPSMEQATMETPGGTAGAVYYHSFQDPAIEGPAVCVHSQTGAPAYVWLSGPDQWLLFHVPHIVSKVGLIGVEAMAESVRLIA
ncbi:MAG: hypothetical protein WDN69_05095 [Aliidongia sp.]